MEDHVNVDIRVLGAEWTKTVIACAANAKYEIFIRDPERDVRFKGLFSEIKTEITANNKTITLTIPESEKLIGEWMDSLNGMEVKHKVDISFYHPEYHKYIWTNFSGQSEELWDQIIRNYDDTYGLTKFTDYRRNYKRPSLSCTEKLTIYLNHRFGPKP
jgi:hypothetical protein